jgi:hypothetical protein
MNAKFKILTASLLAAFAVPSAHALSVIGMSIADTMDPF